MFADVWLVKTPKAGSSKCISGMFVTMHYTSPCLLYIDDVDDHDDDDDKDGGGGGGDGDLW